MPCYNKAGVILQVLDALVRQTLSQREFEVLVVDDGSTDGTQDIVAGTSLPASFRYLPQRNRGAAVARNLGVREAHGDLILFLDADVVADPGLLEAHVASHERRSHVLIMGRLRDLPPESTNLFHDVIHSTAVFDHGEQEKELPFIDGFTGNLSLTRDAFDRIGPFDEAFPRSGFEDTEFIYRATRMGYPLVYDPTGVGYHDSFVTFEGACRHLRSYQASAVLLINRHPEIAGQIPHLVDKEPVQWGQDSLRLVVRKLARQTLALPPSIWLMKGLIAAVETSYPNPSLLRFLYWKVLGSHLLLGFRDGMKRYGSPFASGQRASVR
jgi:glycosyltransferase involved in cell wall biosynthesis